MRKPMTILLLVLGMTATAQTVADPVLMTVNGKDVTRSEFEYSYNKNSNVENAVEKKTVEEYVPMFINYKLKVAAAEAARLDTMKSFRDEFRTYRDMQLTPYLTDTAYIDSVAQVVYQNTAKRLAGKDLIRPAHILIQLKQNAGEAEKAAAKEKADSICQLLTEGADFADLAKRFSADPGSAVKGGQLPLMGPGSTVKEFEEAAYALEAGQTSAPVLSPYGYHIIRMTERHPLEPYTQVRADIIQQLKRYQNIEEASSEHKIEQIIAHSGGRLTREEVLDSVMNANIAHNADLRFLIQEYHDGLLLYEISKRQVWDVAANDSTGLEQWYKDHKKQYAWKEPRFKGYIYQCKNAKDEKAVKKLLKKVNEKNFKTEVRKAFNTDSTTVSVTGPFLCKQGESAHVDKLVFDKKGNPTPSKGFVLIASYGKVLKQPKSYLDVKAEVAADYQAYKEEEWVKQLRQRFSYKVNDEVLRTVNSH